MGSIGNLLCLTPLDSYLIDEPVDTRKFLARLERKTGSFLRSPGVGFPYLIGHLRRHGVISPPTRVAVQHDRIEGQTPFESILKTKLDTSVGDGDVLFITSYTNSAREAYRRAREAREAYRAMGRKLTVVLGGAHASALPDEGTRLGHVDAVVTGEGEWAAAELLADLQAGRTVKPLYAATFNRIRDKGSLTLDMSIWRGLDPAPQQVISSTTLARGCKLDCNFCAVKLTNGELVRNRDYSDVADDLRAQVVPYDRNTIAEAPPGFYNDLLKRLVRLPWLGRRYGDALVRKMGPGFTDQFFFWDDNLFNARGSFRRVLEEIRPLGRTWAAQLTMDVAEHPELLKLAYDSGCRELFLGIESVNQTGLDDLDKWSNQTASMKEYVQRVHDAGIKVMGAFVFGLEGDDNSVFDRTLEFVYKNGIDFIVANIIQPYPGTGTFQDAVAAGEMLPCTASPRDSDIAMDYNWPLFDGAHVLVRPHRMTEDELQQGYYYFLKEAYSLRGISRRYRLEALGPAGFPAHFARNYLVSRYGMIKTAYAIKKKVRRPQTAPLAGLAGSALRGAGRAGAVGAAPATD